MTMRTGAVCRWTPELIPRWVRVKCQAHDTELPHRSTPAAVSFVGLGQPGGPMAANLLAAGHHLNVRDADPKRARRFVAPWRSWLRRQRRRHDRGRQPGHDAANGQVVCDAPADARLCNRPILMRLVRVVYRPATDFFLRAESLFTPQRTWRGWVQPRFAPTGECRCTSSRMASPFSP